MALFSSCKMYDNLPEGDDKPALYLTKEMGKLTDLLTGNANGWRLVLLPGSYQYGGINIAFKFHKGGAVDPIRKISMRSSTPAIVSTIRLASA